MLCCLNNASLADLTKMIRDGVGGVYLILMDGSDNRVPVLQRKKGNAVLLFNSSFLEIFLDYSDIHTS